jgi:hypothetical protein
VFVDDEDEDIARSPMSLEQGLQKRQWFSAARLLSSTTCHERRLVPEITHLLKVLEIGNWLTPSLGDSEELGQSLLISSENTGGRVVRTKTVFQLAQEFQPLSWCEIANTLSEERIRPAKSPCGKGARLFTDDDQTGSLTSNVANRAMPSLSLALKYPKVPRGSMASTERHWTL